MTRLYIYGAIGTVSPNYPIPTQPLGLWSIPDPGNWNPNNHLIECVMPGYSGSYSSFGPPEGTTWGTSSNGGSYAYGTVPNLTFPVPVTMMIGAQQQVQTGPEISFNFNSQNTNRSPTVRAGNNTTIQAPGGFTPAGFSGGGGGGGGESGTSPGGPGGGAAGPHGAGQNATNPTTPGAGDAGQTPISPAGTDGTNGTQWDNIHGCGAGGWQGDAATNSHNGGLFGGGSGGTNSLSGRGSGIGGRGLMIITYTPIPKPQGQAQIMA